MHPNTEKIPCPVSPVRLLTLPCRILLAWVCKGVPARQSPHLPCANKLSHSFAQAYGLQYGYTCIASQGSDLAVPRYLHGLVSLVRLLTLPVYSPGFVWGCQPGKAPARTAVLPLLSKLVMHACANYSGLHVSPGFHNHLEVASNKTNFGLTTTICTSMHY